MRYVKALFSHNGRAGGRQSIRPGVAGTRRGNLRVLEAQSVWVSGLRLVTMALQLGARVCPPTGPTLYAAFLRPPVEVATSFSTSKPVPRWSSA